MASTFTVHWQPNRESFAAGVAVFAVPGGAAVRYGGVVDDAAQCPVGADRRRNRLAVRRVEHLQQQLLAGVVVGGGDPGPNNEVHLERLAVRGLLDERVGRVHVEGGRCRVRLQPVVDDEAVDGAGELRGELVGERVHDLSDRRGAAGRDSCPGLVRRVAEVPDGVGRDHLVVVGAVREAGVGVREACRLGDHVAAVGCEPGHGRPVQVVVVDADVVGGGAPREIDVAA